MDLCHLKNFGVSASIIKVQRQSRTPRWHCERWFRIIRSIYWTRIISITDDSRKSHGHYFKTTGMRRTSSSYSIRLYPGQKWKMRRRYWRFQSQNVQIFGCVYRNTNDQNHGPVWKTQLFLLNGICTVILWQGNYGKDNLRKLKLEHGWEKVPNWEFLFITRAKGLFLSVYVDGIKRAGKKHNINPTWKILVKDVDLEEPTPCLDRVYLGCTQRECQISRDIVDKFRSVFESRVSVGAMEKLPTIESQQEELHRAQRDEQLRRDQQLLHEQLLEQNRDLREAHIKSLNEMEELKRFQGSTFDTFSRRKLIEDRDTILDCTAKIQELQNEVNCKNDSRDFQGAESVRSGQSHVTSQPVFFPLVRDPGGMLSRSLGMPSRNNGPLSTWDTHGKSGNVFANPTASSSAPYPQESNPWRSNVSEHTSPHVMSEPKHQFRIRDASQDRQPEIHSSQVSEDHQRIMGQTNKDCRFQILILTNSPRQQRSLVGRKDSRLRYVLVHNFQRKLCCGSKKWSWLIQWMISNLRAL